MTKEITPEGIMQLGLGFWGSKTLLSAIEIDLFSELAKGPLDANTIASCLHLHQRSVRDFLDALVALHMLEREDGKYRNTPETDLFLDREKPSYAGGILEMANARLYPFWGGLTEALRTGKPQNEAKTGGNPFEKIYADPERLESFLSAMTGISLSAAMAIAHQFPWKDYKTFADIGDRKSTRLNSSHLVISYAVFCLKKKKNKTKPKTVITNYMTELNTNTKR